MMKIQVLVSTSRQIGPGTVFPASELPPKENPYKDFEDRNPMAGIEDETRDYYLKYLKDRPENARGGKDKIIPLKTFAPAFIKENAANGGMMRQNFAVGAVALPALSYPATFGLAKALGIATAGVGATELGNNVTDYLKENPEVMDTPQFRGIALAFGINIPGYIAPDADEMEREAEKIRELTKTKGFGEGEQLDIPLTTGGSEPPKIETKEEFPAETKKLPISTGGTEIIEPKKGDNIFYSKDVKENTKQEIKDTFDKSQELYEQKKMTEVKELTNKEFAKKVANFIDTYHEGRVEPAVKELLGTTEKTTEVENLRIRINRLFNNRGIERSNRAGNIAPTKIDFEPLTEKTSWSNFTTKISEDSNYLKSLTKPLIKDKLIDKSEYYPIRDIEKIYSIKHEGSEKEIRSKRADMSLQLSKLNKDGSVRKIQKGKYPEYHLGDLTKLSIR